MSLKYYSRANIYKNYSGDNIVDLENLRATSYMWWPYLKKIGEKIVFNDFQYSNTTRKHQNQCKNLLRDHGVDIDLTIETRSHLDDLDGCIEELEGKIKELEALIAKPRTHKKKNQEREEQIIEIRRQILTLEHLKGGAQ